MSPIVVEITLLEGCLRQALHLDSVHNLFQSASIVEECYREEEEAQAVDATHHSVKGVQPAISIGVIPRLEREGKDRGKTGCVGQDIEYQEEWLQKIWLLVPLLKGSW